MTSEEALAAIQGEVSLALGALGNYNGWNGGIIATVKGHFKQIRAFSEAVDFSPCLCYHPFGHQVDCPLYQEEDNG